MKIHLTFAKQQRIKASINFVTFIYQESVSTKNNCLMCFDICKGDMEEPINISPTKEFRDLLYKDEYGLNAYSLCRISDVEDNDSEMSVTRNKKQMVRYAYFVLYSDKIGRIKSNEFFYTHCSEGVKI